VFSAGVQPVSSKALSYLGKESTRSLLSRQGDCRRTMASSAGSADSLSESPIPSYQVLINRQGTHRRCPRKPDSWRITGYWEVGRQRRLVDRISSGLPTIWE